MPGSSERVPIVARGPASDLIRSAIRADMEARIERVIARLEADSARWGSDRDSVPAIEAALTEVTGIVAAGVVARIRESAAARA